MQAGADDTGTLEHMAKFPPAANGAEHMDAYSRDKAIATATAARLELRRCVVCEWEGEVVKIAGADPDCPWCHGPTAALSGEELESANDHSNAKNPHAAALGRLGGLKGGRARAQMLSAKRRREIASKAAKARWAKR
jgi:hypothetical protein